MRDPLLRKLQSLKRLGIGGGQGQNLLVPSDGDTEMDPCFFVQIPSKLGTPLDYSAPLPVIHNAVRGRSKADNLI